MIKVLIADNHLLIREGVQRIVEKTSNMRVVGEAVNSIDLHAQLQQLQPDVLVIDCFMPGFFSPEDLSIIKESGKAIQILVVTINHNKQDIMKVLSYGINNYILKQCDQNEFINAVNATAKKEKFLCGKVVDALVETHFPQESNCEGNLLSRREVEIINYIAQGLTNIEIADKIHLSVHTVNTHRRNILRKLQMKNSSELILHGIRSGIIQC